MIDNVGKECQSFNHRIAAHKGFFSLPLKGNRSIFLTLLFLFFTSLGSATNYYVSNSGNDSNAGTTPETAWQTINKVNNTKFAPGDQILLKAGDIFDGPLKISNSGTSGSPITVSKYGTGAKPIIYGDHPSVSWSAVDGHPGIYKASIYGGTIQNIYDINGNKYNKNTQGITPLETWISSFSQGDWGFTFNPQVMYIRTLDDKAPPELHIFEWAIVYANGSASYVTFDNLDVRNGYMGIVISGADNVVVQNNNVQDMCNTGIYFGKYINNLSYNGEIANNTITRTGWTSVYLSEGGDHWVHHNKISHTLDTILGIAINGVELCGIGLQQGQDNLVEYNNISYVKDSFFDYWLEVGSIVRYNKGFHAEAAAFPDGTGLKLYYNIFDLDGVGRGIGGGHHYDSELSPAPNLGPNQIYNNTVYDFISYGIYFAPGSDVIYRNNLIIENSSAALINVNSGIDIDYNVYYNNAGDTRNWYWNGIRYTTLSAFHAASGQEAHSAAADPLFTDAANGDFSLQAGSPAINHGVDVGLTQDINGNPIVGAPDIGAYESGTTNMDIEKPSVTGFSIPTTSTSLTVPIADFTATDNIGVTGYLVTETATMPTAGAAGWSADKPTTYTFSSTGTKNLYAWAKDAAGNVSEGVSDQVDITLATTETNTTPGNTEVYGSTTTVPNRRAMPVTFSEAGNINSISIYHEGGTGQVLLGVYSDDSGSPGSLLGVTQATTIHSTAGWQTVSLLSPVTVKSDQTIWLSWVFENNPGIRYTTGTPGRAQSADTWSSGMPQSFGTSDYADYRYSVYCNYTPEGSSIAGTAGHTEVYGSTTTVPNRRAMPVTFSEAGNINSISVYHEGGTGQVLLGVYSNDSGSPGSLLGVTPATTINSTAGWQTVSLISAVAVNLGQTVWLSWVFENNPGIRYTTGTPGRAQSADTWSSGMPQTFGTADVANYRYSVYCNYTSGGSSIAGTAGHTEVYGSTTTVPNRRAMPVIFSEAGNINSISIWHEGGTGRVLLGVYSDQSGSPGSLLGVTSSTTIHSTTGWQTVSLISPVVVNAGQTVWLSWVFENNPGIRYTTGTPGRAQSADTWSSGMPPTFGASDVADYQYSVYCNYTAITSILAATVAGIAQNEPSIFTGNTTNAATNSSIGNSVYPLETVDFKIYPNPAKSFVNVDYSILPEIKTRIILLDGSGRVIVNRVVDSSTNRIDISELSPGLYYIKSVNRQWNSTKKLMVDR